MAVIDIYNANAEKVSERDIKDDIFAVAVREDVLHQVVRSQLAHSRSGTASTKNRSQVSASTRKLWRQKGTGRARVGASSSPLRRGGGVVFGPTPRDYSLKVNKKVKKAALRMALADKFREGNVIVIDTFQLEEIKTKRFFEILQNFNVDNVLIVSDAQNEILERSCRNIPNVKLLRAEGLNVYDILRYEHLLFIEPALGRVEEALGQ
ncbi:MAG TPA: 50S ribosomal protein L4 [Desulfatiglandales bacterium]|nr:50S ribosomal protein L4 [Desulfatiglandales bacterium]